MKQVTKTLIKTDAVAAALAHVNRIATPAGKDALTELTKRRAQLARLTGLHSELFGVEAYARERVQNERDKLRTRVQQLEAVVLPAVHQYKVFDLEPLRWRDAAGMPRLAVFHLTHPVFEFRTEMYRDGTVKGQFIPARVPDDLLACYNDVDKRVARMARAKKMTARLRIDFTGVIPNDVREKIADARRIFGDKMYIVAEPAKASIELTAASAKPKPRAIREGDPLVIGFDGRQYRLIAAFDLSSIEKVVHDRIRGIKAS